MQSLNTHSGAWSNRQGMWPLSERKLVFACKKEIVTQQWLDNFAVVFKDVNGENGAGEAAEAAAEEIAENGGRQPEEEEDEQEMISGVIDNVSISQNDMSRGF